MNNSNFQLAKGRMTYYNHSKIKTVEGKEREEHLMWICRGLVAATAGIFVPVNHRKKALL